MIINNFIMKNQYIQIFILSLFLVLFSNVSKGQNDTTKLQNKNQIASDNYFSLQEKGRYEFEILSKDNEIREQKIYKYMFLAIAGIILIIGLFVIFVFYSKSKKIADLIDIQNREIQLREIQIGQLSTILNTVQSAVILTSADGKIKWLNKTFNNFYGINLETLQQENKDNFITNIAGEKEKEYIEKCMTDKQSVSYFIDAGENKKYKLQRNIFVITDDKGNISGLAITDNKITE